MVILSVTDLQKMYGRITAVAGISFQVEQGEIFDFLGPNGAGKTTTINMLTGLARPSAGQIWIDGLDGVEEIKKAQSIMGIVPDESNLWDDLDGFENLCFCGALYGLDRARRQERARELLEQFGLASLGSRPFRAYSKGLKRRLTIAAALIHHPRILFLDEPTTGIDVESARQIRRLILDLKRSGTTVFLTTHYIEEAERLCDRVAFLVEGRIKKAGTLRELMAQAGDGQIIKVALADAADALEPELQRAFPRLQVEIKGSTCTLHASGQIALLPILEFFEVRGLHVLEARAVRPSLEDVFVQITGVAAGELLRGEGGCGR